MRVPVLLLLSFVVKVCKSSRNFFHFRITENIVQRSNRFARLLTYISLIALFAAAGSRGTRANCVWSGETAGRRVQPANHNMTA